MKKFIKFIKLIIIVSTIIVIGVLSKITLDGVELYNKTMEDKSISKIIFDIRNSENYVTIDNISNDFLEAIVVVEDRRFYSHSGFDIKSFGRALIRNIKEKEFAAGGSTITQQLAKNLFFSFEKTIDRKVAEYLVAKDIEKSYSKDEILEIYINIIYYGDLFYGISDATDGYFNKKPSEITKSESILLSGLPQAPSSYALFENLDRAKKRSFIVLDALKEYGCISEVEYEYLKYEIEKIELK